MPRSDHQLVRVREGLRAVVVFRAAQAREDRRRGHPQAREGKVVPECRRVPVRAARREGVLLEEGSQSQEGRLRAWGDRV